MGGSFQRRSFVGCIVVALTMASSIAVGAQYVFNDDAYLGEARLLPEWSDTVTRNAAEQSLIADCLADQDGCSGKLKGIRHLLLKAQGLPRDRQIRLVNRYVNKRRYRRDRRQHKVSAISNEPAVFRNHWSTIMEFVCRGGDCEDYATTKYFLLRTLGVPSDDLRVVVIYDRKVRDYHAVLAIRNSSGAVWLMESDNSIQKGNLYNYKFIYSVNEESIWDHEGATS
jgi:predicted transglutaminase-like cysteine proteinase